MLLQNDSAADRPGRLRGRARRSQSIGTKLTEQEESIILSAAEKAGKAPGEWARDVLVSSARSRDSLQDSMLFVELQALRLLLINTLEPLLRGEKMTPEQFKDMLRYVKNNKRKAATDMLASYADGTTEQL
jgi:hypothetical protein